MRFPLLFVDNGKGITSAVVMSRTRRLRSSWKGQLKQQVLFSGQCGRVIIDQPIPCGRLSISSSYKSNAEKTMALEKLL